MTEEVTRRGGQAAVRSDHTLWCWGNNEYGQLGLGDIVNRHTPTQVGTDTDWARISTADSLTCGTHTDHTLWCWGDIYGLVPKQV